MRKRQRLCLVAILMLPMLLAGCIQETYALKDGYYSAEEADFSETGWKEYITIYVSNGQIKTVEYDAFNRSGFIKSWDIDYMRIMKTESGTYPNEYTRIYTESLISWQDADKLDAVTGATHSYTTFTLLADAAIAKAAAGDKHVALVKMPQ